MTIPGPAARAREAAGPIDARLRAAGLPPLPLNAWVEVDLDALEANARSVRRLLPDGGLLGVVVKANGYGHGLEMSARAAVAGGADWLIVGTLEEGLRLRQFGIAAPIFVTYPTPPATYPMAAAAALDVVAGDRASVEALPAAVAGAAPGGPPLRVHLEIDTGLTRGGALPADVVAAARALATRPGIVFAGIWSHLRTPEDPDASAAQVARFEAALGDLATAGIGVPARHMAASHGLFGAACPPYDAVRLGYAFYGLLDPTVHPTGRAAEVAALLRPALTLKCRAVRVATVPAGTEVGYGGTWRAERQSVIVTLPVGYADGWTRTSAPGTDALFRGRRVPLVGRVSMDAVGVDVGDAGPIGEDEEFVLIGRQGDEAIDADEVARVRGSISREVLSILGPRLPRVYLRGDRPVALSTFPGSPIVEAAGA